MSVMKDAARRNWAAAAVFLRNSAQTRRAPSVSPEARSHVSTIGASRLLGSRELLMRMLASSRRPVM